MRKEYYFSDGVRGKHHKACHEGYTVRIHRSLLGADESRMQNKVLHIDGGSFVLAGGLTMDGIQAERTLEAARRFDPAMESRLRELYNWPVGEKPSYAPPRAYTA